MGATSTKRHSKLIYLAAIMMIVGIHLPLYSVSEGSKVVLVNRVNNEGILLLISAILLIVFMYTKRYKYIFAPFIFQLGVIFYYIFLIKKTDNVVSIGTGGICEAIAVFIVFISLIPKKNIKKDYAHDISTLKVIKTEEYEYCDDIKFKDFLWILGVMAATIIYVVFSIGIDNIQNYFRY